MVRRVALAVWMLTLALPAAAARADETHWTATPEGYAAHLSSVGAWEFSALKKGIDGKPECYESWNFAADGTGTVISGEQVLDMSWRYVKDDVVGMVLRVTYNSSTSGKDCLGREVDPAKYPKKDGAGIELLFFNGGQNATVCNAPRVLVDEKGEFRLGPDGNPMTLQSLDNCWGNLKPAAAN